MRDVWFQTRRQSPYDFMMNGRDENGMPVGLKLIPGYKVETLVMETLVW